MRTKNNVLIVDPTPYPGGSKFATENILKLLDKSNYEITVISADACSWNGDDIKHIAMFQPKWISNYEIGILYFLRHLFIVLQIVYLHIFVKRFDIALGASGPGVDLSLYMAKPFIGFNIVQLIHGPIATSNTIRRCMKVATQVHYLESTEASLLRCLNLNSPLELRNDKYHILCNGLPDDNWPSPCQENTPVIFWAASLLKWKGIAVLLEALELIDEEYRPLSNICYIRPKTTSIPMSNAPVDIRGVHWHEQPEHLNEIRARSNIFVSTSKSEPFGLSILEAMAAGHCVVIPKDGAFWDGILEDGKNCIKYEPNNSKALSITLLRLSINFENTVKIGREAAACSKHYRASFHYASIIKAIEYFSLRPYKLSKHFDGKTP